MKKGASNGVKQASLPIFSVLKVQLPYYIEKSVKSDLSCFAFALQNGCQVEVA